MKSASSLGSISTGEQVAQAKFTYFVPGPFLKYFGELAENFRMMGQGEPGAGKTYFLLMFANWLAENLGPVLYVSYEEYNSATLTQKVKEVGATSSNLFFKGSLDKNEIPAYKVVFIDSINHAGITYNEFKDMREKNPEVAFVLIMQRTKDGKFKGDKNWEHLVDIAMEFTLENILNERTGKERLERHINITKNRFGTYYQGKI